jgi:hypothetical protein
MPQRPSPRLLSCAAALLALAALGPARAADPPPAQATGWRAGTRPAAPAAPAAEPAGQMRVRVYEGFGTLGPVYGARDTPLAVDVDLGLVTCPDGDTEIGTMDIGGMRYDVAGTCDDVARGAVTVHGAATAGAAPVAQAGTAPAARGPIRCDPATWRCTGVQSAGSATPAPPPAAGATTPRP